MSSHLEQARVERALGTGFAEQRDAAMRDRDNATARIMGGMSKAHLRAAEILEVAHAALSSAVEAPKAA